MERGGEVRPGSGVGQAAPQLTGELAVGQPAHAVESPDGALPGPDGEGQQLGDGRELREHPGLAPRGPARQEVVGTGHAETEADDGHHDEGDDAAVPDDEEEGACSTAEDRSEGSPQHLLRAEPVDVRGESGAQLASSHALGAAHDALDHLPELAQHRGRHHPERAGCRAAVVEQPRRPRRVPQVGQHPARQPGAPVPRQTQPDERQPEPQDEPEHRSLSGQGAHRSTRSSSGSRPIRIIAQYATAVTAAPTASTSTPSGVE